MNWGGLWGLEFYILLGEQRDGGKEQIKDRKSAGRMDGLFCE